MMCSAAFKYRIYAYYDVLVSKQNFVISHALRGWRVHSLRGSKIEYIRRREDAGNPRSSEQR